MATTIVEPTDDQLIDRSELIVVGTVSRTHTTEISGSIFTDTTISIAQVLRGDPMSQVTVRELGGVIGGRSTVAFGAPTYTQGERVLAFLSRQEDGTWTTVDLYIGKFTERKTIDGDSIWYRPASVRGTRTISQNSANATMQRRARAFEDYVVSKSDGGRRQPNYFVENPRYAREVGADFALLSDPNVYRWFAFDEGRQVAFRSSGKQRGYEQGGIPELQTALASWAGYTEANIRLSYSGALDQVPGGLKDVDGVNAIIFNDAKNEIDGTWNGKSGIIGRASYNAVKRDGTWVSTDADTAHASKTYAEVWEIVEGDVVIQDGVSPLNSIGSTRLAQLIAHEIGHTLGFAHSQDAEALMASTIDGTGPSLRSDDRAAARWLYPVNGNVPNADLPAEPVLADFGVSDDHPSISDPVGLQDASKGSPSVWQWQFGDGATSAERNPTHRYNTPGLYTVALTVGRGASTSTKTRLLRVSEMQEIDSLLPVAVQTTGAASTNWRTELSLFNGGENPLTVQFTFLPATGGNGAGRAVTIAPRETLSYESALPEIFGISSGAGGLLIESSAGMSSASPLRISSRTFTSSPEGTYGQFVPTLEQLPKQTYIAGISSNAAFRTNIGIVNQSVNDAAAELKLYDMNGTEVGTASVYMSGHSFQQVGITSLFPQLQNADLGTLALSVRADRANALAAYASVIDNISQDPVLVPARGISSSSLILPGSAHVEGSGGTFWRTDLTLFNPEETAMTVTLGRLGSSVRREVTLPARGSLRLADVLSWLEPSATQGALTIESNGPTSPVVSARTYTARGDGGSFGQWIPAMNGAALSGQMNLTGLRVDGEFRTNVGFVNPSTAPAEVTLDLYAGAQLLGSRVVTVPASGQLQQSAATLFPEIATSGAQKFSLRTTTSGDSVGAFASVVDNRSGDATFISAQ